MRLNIKKRDGTIVPFQSEKIVSAIRKAASAEEGECSPQMDMISIEIANDIENALEESKSDIRTVEAIQDMVENELMKKKKFSIAKAYITYRYKHGMARSKYRELMDAVEEKLMATNVENQNANVDERSFGGRVGEASDLIMKNYALDYLISEKTKQNHLNNEIYIHDLNRYAVGCHNCLSIPFDDLLAKGFNTRQTDVRPAQSVNTAFQLLAVIFQLQSLQQFGGVSATHLDWTMVPYVRKSFFKHYRDGAKYLENRILGGDFTDDMSIEDKKYKESAKVYQYAMDMTDRETKQAAEGLLHNLNTLQSRSGNQLK